MNRLEFARKNFPVIKIFMHEIPFHTELREQFKETVAVLVLEKAYKAIRHFQAEGQLIELPEATTYATDRLYDYRLSDCSIFVGAGFGMG